MIAGNLRRCLAFVRLAFSIFDAFLLRISA